MNAVSGTSTSVLLDLRDRTLHTEVTWFQTPLRTTHDLCVGVVWIIGRASLLNFRHGDDRRVHKCR